MSYHVVSGRWDIINTIMSFHKEQNLYRELYFHQYHKACIWSNPKKHPLVGELDGLILQCGSGEKTQPELSMSIRGKHQSQTTGILQKKLVQNNMKHLFHFLGWWARRKVPNMQFSWVGGTFFKISFVKKRICLNIC